MRFEETVFLKVRLCVLMEYIWQPQRKPVTLNKLFFCELFDKWPVSVQSSNVNL